MGAKSNIQWTNSSWNPVRGCSMAKGSETGGCLNCYAARFNSRNLPGLMSPTTGKPFARILDSGPRWTGDVELIESQLTLPLKWKTPRKIFVNSQSDLFHESLPDEAIDRVFAVMALCPQHTFQILTKRADRMINYLCHAKSTLRKDEVFDAASALLNKRSDVDIRAVSWDLPAWPLPNVWLGVSVENQATADARIPLLLQTPAAKRFVSYEPALGPVDFTRINYTWLLRESLVKFARWAAEKDGDDVEDAAKQAAASVTDTGIPDDEKPRLDVLNATWFDGWDSGTDGKKLDWIIVGGESGPGARPFNITWARSTVHQCKAAGVACFVKQLGVNPQDVAFPSDVSEIEARRWQADGWTRITMDASPGPHWRKYMRLKDRKGGDMSEWPEDLRVQNFPE